MKPFRVLQFNMQFGQVWDDNDPNNAPVRLEEAIAEIVRHDADIIHLQEVEHARPAGDQAQPAVNYQRLKAALPGYHSYFAYPKADPRELPFGIGLAIFSKTPLRDPFAEDLPSPPIEFDFFGETKTPTDRLLIGAKTTVDGRDLLLLNTHLLAFFMLKSDSRSHPGQRLRIAEHLRAAAGAPLVLTGDFNVRDHVGLAEQFAAEGFATVQTTDITWRRMPYVLDHIFHNAALRCVRREVVPTLSSDHHVLIADFVWA
ncbi:MAG: endonuclease/exonuclease/phosphatase family protein [Burkholderiales bacterium]|nr:endonuclease/exonuclease/phosphatase family protein [Opitutaceae bacterium]